MRNRQRFVRPEIRQELTLLLDAPVLQGSISEQTTIISTGQPVEEYDFSGTEKEWSFTKGSGGAIRPMVDPHYAL